MYQIGKAQYQDKPQSSSINNYMELSYIAVQTISFVRLIYTGGKTSVWLGSTHMQYIIVNVVMVLYVHIHLWIIRVKFYRSKKHLQELIWWNFF